MTKLIIKSAGPFTTIQDLGRYGYQKYGIPPSGAMDGFALQIANILVGNKRNEAALEITSAGFSAIFQGECEIAITGADLGATLNGKAITPWQSFHIQNGDVLKFEKVKTGCRAYLSVGGGWDVPKILGSKSTYTRANIGGYHGRKLKNADVIEIGKSYHFAFRNVKIPSHIVPTYSNHKVRVILGPESNRFSKKEINKFLSSSYRLTGQSDRMGYRLSGPTLRAKRGKHDILSNGVLLGAIQVPPDGQPIVMMSDHQTVGGYAKISTVISADIPLLAQLKPGDNLSFKHVSFEEARKAYLSMQNILDLLEKQIRKEPKVFFVKIGEKFYKVKVRACSKIVPKEIGFSPR